MTPGSERERRVGFQAHACAQPDGGFFPARSGRCWLLEVYAGGLAVIRFFLDLQRRRLVLAACAFCGVAWVRAGPDYS